MQILVTGDWFRATGLAALLVLAASAEPARAQAADDGPRPSWQPFASFTPWGQGDADLDAGGDFRASGMIVRAGVGGPIGNGHRAGLTLNYDYTDYRFSSPTAFGGLAPWDDIQRIGLSAPLVFSGANGWSYLVTPSVDYFMEDDAKSSEALAYGAVVAAAKRFGPDRLLGFGVGVFDRLEEVSVLPVILVDWKLTERLRIENPLAAGPTGGAGLELNYRFDGGWVLGGGAAYRTVRFRLNENGPVPNGIGEERGVAGFFHAGRTLGGTFRLDLYAGALFGGELRLENASGDELVREDFDPAPFVGATLTARF
jgi:hypothetical protein